MTKENAMQFFIDKLIPDDQIIREINSILNFQVETIEIPVSKSEGFLQTTEYPEGFKVGYLISWPNNVCPNLVVTELSNFLSEKFQCQVLSEADADEWYLSEPGCVARKVEVCDLNRGIAIIT